MAVGRSFLEKQVNTEVTTTNPAATTSEPQGAAEIEAAERASKLPIKDLGKQVLEPGPTELKIGRRHRSAVRPEED